MSAYCFFHPSTEKMTAELSGAISDLVNVCSGVSSSPPCALRTNSPLASAHRGMPRVHGLCISLIITLNQNDYKQKIKQCLINARQDTFIPPQVFDLLSQDRYMEVQNEEQRVWLGYLLVLGQSLPHEPEGLPFSIFQRGTWPPSLSHTSAG